MRLAGKVAIITGSSSGLGQATAILFAQEGAKVVVFADHNVKGGEETVRKIKEAGGEAVFVQGSVTKASDCKRLVKTAIDTFGKLNVLVNNAGIEIRGGILNLSEEDWDKMLSVDLKGIFMVSREAVPEMIKAGGGSIVNVASVLSFGVVPERVAYVAAKGGVLQVSRSIALDCAKYNIRCNSLIPGFFLTPMLEQSLTDSGDYAGTKKTLENKSLFGRAGQPEELARAALFLASDESSFTTGSALHCDGGWFVN